MKKNINMSKSRLWLLGITAFLILMVVLFAVFKPESPAPEMLDEQEVAVSVMRVEPGGMKDVIELPGKVEPVDDVTVAAELAGRVVELSADEGDRVKAGDVLMRIDDRLRRASVRRAEITAKNARRDLVRLSDLRETGAVSQSEFEAVETAAETAEIALEEASIHLENCTPESPVTGAVEERFVSVGEYVNTGNRIFRIIDDTRVKIVFEVPERDVLTLRPGEKYVFKVDALPDSKFEGNMVFVSASADKASNTFRAELLVDNTEGLLRGGMIARVMLARGFLENVVLLPMNAVVPMKGETVVFVFEEGRAVRWIVRVGSILDSQAVIKSGVDVGDDVIIDGNRSVLDGTPVRVIESWSPAPLDSED